jgi:hypothetical protein
MTPPREAGLRGALARFWQRDESLALLLVLLIVVAFILPPLSPSDGPRGPVAATFFSLMLVAGVATVMRQKRWIAIPAMVLCLAALPLRWAASLDSGDRFASWSAATDTLALVVLAVVVLGMVLRPGEVTRQRVQGAVAAYLLFGLAWAASYEWAAQNDPSAFNNATAENSQQWIYYSLITISSTGYGDITPAKPVTRSLAVAEAITGQLYIAIMISRLVALELQSRQER